jgi:phytoene synthase
MDSALESSYRFCDDVARREAANFYPAFRLLPAERRRSMVALYAFLRRTDDLADDATDPASARIALDAWRRDLDHVLDGSSHPDTWDGWPALAHMVDRHALPRRHLHEVIDGVLMDVDPRPFETFADLRRYCYHVASAVGLSCLHIWGFRSEGGRAERLAESAGIALQLTNILRDVREDAEKGRIYLPREDLDRFGVDARALATSSPPSKPVHDLFAFQASRASAFYAESRGLAPLVAPVGRPVLRAIVGIYHALLDEIARRDYDVLAGRVRVPGWRKAMITMKALVA